MTLVVGLTCDDGVVLASDSQFSRGSTRSTGEKIWAVGSGPFIFGVAGADSTLQRFRDGLNDFTLPTDDYVRAALGLQTRISDILGREYLAVRQVIGQHDWDSMPVASCLVGMLRPEDDLPCLLISDRSGAVSEAREFYAIGWGAPFGEHAAAVFREMRKKAMTLHQASMLAYRIVEDAIEIAGPNNQLGKPIQLATLTRAEQGIRATKLADDDALTADAVANWRQVEAEMFRSQEPPA